MSQKRILVIDDEPNLIASIFRIFSNDDVAMFDASNGKEGLKKVVEVSPEVIVVDYKMPEMDGLTFLKAVQSIRADIPVVVMTAHGNKSAAMEFLTEGAYRYLEKPFRPDEFKHIVMDAVSHYRLKSQNSKLQHLVNMEHDFDEIIGQSQPMQVLFQMINKVADTDATVLIQGESGTGKELIAKAIHERSSRKDQPFIRFNCAALPETLIESELFGHEKGAFTGAEDQKMGRFELAQGGTLFFDEIGELNPFMQVKLLRVLQEREYERVGGTQTLEADIRIIAATNQNLQEMMGKGKFREDLYFRLNNFPIMVSPLRERTDDVILLAQYFLEKYSKEYAVNIKGFTDGALAMLKRYDWKGNVRELQNVISRSIILASDGMISENTLNIHTQPSSNFIHQVAQERLTEAELVNMYAKEVYKRSGYNKKEACKVLDINYRTLVSRLS